MSMQKWLTRGMLGLLLTLGSYAAHAGDSPSDGMLAHKPMVLRQLVIMQHPQALADITLTDDKGLPRKLTDHPGRITILSLWATWCTLCVRDLRHLQQLEAKLDPQQIVIVPLSIDTELALIAPFLQQHQLHFKRMWRDPQQQLGQILPTDVVPATFLLDAQGQLMGFVRGYVDWADDAVAPYLRQLAAHSLKEASHP
ncbi:TlpA family protein disulfide reductase [Shewanella sp. YIC-542]|uniref:TlpA family protein disulfide reductase n=1 Tax=Shewanella mytili TaxID=3377111 RepID=UPI00398E6CF1